MLLRIVLVVACYESLALIGPRLAAQTLWTENAENGTSLVTTNVSGYSLIQSDIVGQGDFAFHLANPSLNDYWFELNTTITPLANTKLYFQSRLGWATPTQVAKVQISTNGGSSWPTTLFSQPGTGNSGEGAFSLQQVNLGSYASQNVRLRFYYDVTSSGFPQTDPGVGWYVDDIQIGSELAKSQWSIGNPTAHEQQYLEYINRARADALVEASRLASETDPDITSAYSFFGVTGANIVNQFNYYVNNGYMEQHAQPLSFNPALLTAAQLHTQDMFDHQFQGHTSSTTPPAPFPANATFGQRLDAVGYSGSGGENVFSFADSVAQGHAGFDVDWGNVTNTSSPAYNPAFAGQGMQNAAGHRLSIHNGDYSEVGIGVINGTNGSVGPQLVTQDFGDPGSVTYVTGVVYEDLNSNNFYDIGEGRSGVRVDVDGSAYYALSSTSGGYSVPVTDDGVYNVLFSGGGFADYSTTATVTGGLNVKVDYLAAANATLVGDYNDDGIVDAADYTVWRDTNGTMGSGLAADGDNNGTINGNDYTLWRTNFGQTQPGAIAPASVPEPTTAFLACAAALVTLASQRKSRR